MRQVFEGAIRGRLFGLRALQGGVGGPIAAVARCLQGYCRVCAILAQRGQALRIGGLGSIFPDQGTHKIANAEVSVLTMPLLLLCSALLFSLSYLFVCAGGAVVRSTARCLRAGRGGYLFYNHGASTERKHATARHA